MVTNTLDFAPELKTASVIVNRTALLERYYDAEPHELPTPCVILNSDILTENASRMHKRIEKLNNHLRILSEPRVPVPVKFRGHVKTLKSTEATKILLSGKPYDSNEMTYKYRSVIVSTIAEVRGLMGLMHEGVVNDVLYGIPPGRSKIPELLAIRKEFSNTEFKVMVDNVDQIIALSEYKWSVPWKVFVKVNVGDNRAGVIVKNDDETNTNTKKKVENKHYKNSDKKNKNSNTKDKNEIKSDSESESESESENEDDNTDYSFSTSSSSLLSGETDSEFDKICNACIFSRGTVQIAGFYAHAGSSYGAHSIDQVASVYVAKEAQSVYSAAERAHYLYDVAGFGHDMWTLSIGATPTAQAFTFGIDDNDDHVDELASSSSLPGDKTVKKINTTNQKEGKIALKDDEEGTKKLIKSKNALAKEVVSWELPVCLEIHAGNYICLDLQQVGTGIIKRENIAISLLADIISYYPDRREILIGAGVLALARENGSLKGYGEVKNTEPDSEGWYVKKVSQEHGILGFDKKKKQDINEIQITDKKESFKKPAFAEKKAIEIVPQHACITAAMHPYYFILKNGKVVDVWVPWKWW